MKTVLSLNRDPGLGLNCVKWGHNCGCWVVLHSDLDGREASKWEGGSRL